MKECNIWKPEITRQLNIAFRSSLNNVETAEKNTISNPRQGKQYENNTVNKL